jgi:hypothetical protein
LEFAALHMPWLQSTARSLEKIFSTRKPPSSAEMPVPNELLPQLSQFARAHMPDGGVAPLEAND